MQEEWDKICKDSANTKQFLIGQWGQIAFIFPTRVIVFLKFHIPTHLLV